MGIINKSKNLCVFILFLIVITSVKADDKSLYMVHHNGLLKAYKINGIQLEYQTELKLTEHGLGAIDLALDENTGTIFVSFEYDPAGSGGGNVIELVDARSMEHIKTIALEEPNDLTGLVYDAERCRLIASERNTRKIYSILWNPADKTLQVEDIIELEDIELGVCGLALNDNLLYVTDYHYFPFEFTNYIRVYDPNDNFLHIEDIDMGNSSVAVAYNAFDNALYAGAYKYGTMNPPTHIIKKVLDPNGIAEKDIGYGVIGIDTDEDTGLVYVTTYRQAGAIEVYDASDWLSNPNPYPYPEFIMYSYVPFNGPAGLIVPKTNISYKPSLLNLYKADDIDPGDDPNYVLPADFITYSLAYSNPEPNTHSNVILIDRLPQEVDYISSAPEGLYDPNTHTVTWQIGNVDPYDPNVNIEITVQVNDYANPLGEIFNFCSLQSDLSYTTASSSTPVGLYGGDIIYVNKEAIEGYNTGISWEHAYTDLQDALNRAKNGGGNEIWVAEGNYKPSLYDKEVSFVMVSDVGIYGGFAGNETQREQRNWRKNKTILSGDLGSAKNEKIIAFSGQIEDSTIDGFTINMGKIGIYCADSIYPGEFETTFSNCIIINNSDYGILLDYYDNSLINNCLVKDNGKGGIRCVNSDVTIISCVIENNQGHGLYFAVSDSSVSNCRIFSNSKDGVHGHSGAKLTVKNNWIHHNAANGVYFYNPPYAGENLLRNNTIVYNSQDGITKYLGWAPPISNCILWGNNNQLGGGCSAAFSCIQDPADPCGVAPGAATPDEYGNISAFPMFGYDDPNLFNFHLDPSSPCIDKGDPAGEYGEETDIDGHQRVFDGNYDENDVVDMGADEYTGGQVGCVADFNADGIVNLADYVKLAAAWLSYDPASPHYPDDPNDAAPWNKICDLNDDLGINVIDLAMFTDHWLWQAGWYEPDGIMMMTRGMGRSEGRDRRLSESQSLSQSSSLNPADVSATQAEIPPDELKTKDELIKMMIQWLLQHQPPGWQEFIKQIIGYLD